MQNASMLTTGMVVRYTDPSGVAHDAIVQTVYGSQAVITYKATILRTKSETVPLDSITVPTEGTIESLLDEEGVDA